MKLHFVRHGLTPHNKLGLTNGQTIDESLAEEGEAQAHQLAEIVPKNVRHIYSSDLLRARQTAAIINQKLGVGLTFHPELREIDLGRLTGKSWKQINELMGRDYRKESYLTHQYDFRPWGGESAEAVLERIKKFLAQAKKIGQESLVVSHGGIIRTVHHLLSGKNLSGGAIDNAGIYSFDIY